MPKTKRRILDTVIAKDDAKIEHRLWDAKNPEALPVVYYIGGNHIEFDAKTLETLAVGQGVLMLRDPREPVGCPTPIFPRRKRHHKVHLGRKTQDNEN